MTTVPSTPTSDGIAGLGGAAGLPDVTLLAQLAGEFFAALPSGSHDARLPFAAPPQPPQTELALANRAPALAPAPARPAAAPDEAVDAATGTGRAANPVYGVPEAYAAALPRVESPEPPRGPSAVLALLLPGRSQRLSSAAPSTPSAPPSHQDSGVHVPEDRVTARSFGLPGDTELRPCSPGSTAASGSTPRRPRHRPSTSCPQRRRAGPRRHPSPRPAFDVQAVRRDFPSCRSGSMAGR
jgi:cysteine desulfurase/selenocysteine lyase